MAKISLGDRSLCLLILSSLIINMGAVRKNFDAIRNTQTESVLWKKVEEQMKEGEKAAAKPTFKFYFYEEFQRTPPIEENKLPQGELLKDRVPAYGSPIPEDIGDEKQDENWWMESWEKPDQSKKSTDPNHEASSSNSQSLESDKNESEEDVWQEKW